MPTNKTLKKHFGLITRDLHLSDDPRQHYVLVIINTVRVLFDRSDDSLKCLADYCQGLLDDLEEG